MQWLRGYVLLEIKGASPERFLNLCKMRNIYTWKIHCENTVYQCCIGAGDFKKLKSVAKKTKTLPRIQKKQGLPFFLRILKRRWGFLIGFFLFWAILIFCSRLLWEIQIEGQYTHSKEELISFLSEDGIHPLIFCRDIHGIQIEEAIRKEYVDIGWVSAQVKGCRLLVQIRETKMPELYQENKSPVHLLAPKSGVISSVIVRRGTVQVKVGDTVKKGDILISGIVDIVGDSDLLLRKEPVAADGDVWIDTSYEYHLKKCLRYKQKRFYQKNLKTIRIRRGDKEFLFSFPHPSIKKSDKQALVTNTYQTLFGVIDLVYEKKYQEVFVDQSIKQGISYMQIKLSKYVDKMLEKKMVIRENNVKIKRIGDSLIADGTIDVTQIADRYRKILDSEWRNTNNDEHSGNDS
ncbi:MAG: hypothetical protein PWP24_905 [Clostridiales bacterium]|nr:hypothetical protein [Clostridiales bacterium]